MRVLYRERMTVKAELEIITVREERREAGIGFGRLSACRGRREKASSFGASMIMTASVESGRAYNAGADQGDLIGRFAHARMPMQSGSRGSSTRSASAFTKADPLILGYMLPSLTFTLASNTLPTMLSCFQV